MILIPIIICLFLVSIDQAVKFICIKHLLPIGSVTVIKNFFYFTYVENKGAAFGSFEGGRLFFIIITAVVIIAAAVYYYKKLAGVNNNFLKVSIIMIVSGGIGNLIDRVFRGYVVDMFHFVFWGHSFAVFNVADILVVCGTILLFLIVIFDSGKEKIK